MVTIGGLWRWEAGSQDSGNPSQWIYAHSECTKDRLKGATMDIEPHIFGEED